MHESRDEIVANIATIREVIAQAAERSDRDPSDVLLVAAAKTVPAEPIRWAVEEGVACIGENYVKELRGLHGEVPGARWHFIGALQTGSAHHVAALADVVETLAGGRATERLARRATEDGRTIEALIEVDFTHERAGIPPEHVPAAADHLSRLEGIRLRGLMTVPPFDLPHDPTSPDASEAARPWFRRLRMLRDEVRDTHPDIVDLSMGMSLDYGAAVEEGATMVRIGTALFGPRTP